MLMQSSAIGVSYTHDSLTKSVRTPVGVGEGTPLKNG